MTNALDRVKGHAEFYYLYYVLSYFLIAPLLMHMLVVLYEGKLNDAHQIFSKLLLGNVLILAACALKHSTRFPRILSQMSLVVGLAFSVRYTIQIFGEMLTVAKQSVYYWFPLVILFLIFIWLVYLYFVDTPIASKAYDKHFLRRVISYYFVIGVFLYAFAAFIGWYYGGQMNVVLSKGSYFLGGSLNSEQIDVLISELNKKRLIMTAMILIFFLILFFLFFTITKRKSIQR